MDRFGMLDEGPLIERNPLLKPEHEWVEVEFCKDCGEDITPVDKDKFAKLHTCKPRIELHRSKKECELCSGSMPQRTYCERCGEDITPSHDCTGIDLPKIHHCEQQRRLL